MINPYGAIATFQRIAGINAPVETRMWCTTILWEKFIGELNALPRDVFMDPTKLATPQNCQRFKIQTTTFLNSGTDAPWVCNHMNAEEERKAGFREKHDRLAQRPGTKPEIDAVDAESTWEVPEELAKAVRDTKRFPVIWPDQF